MKVVLVVAGSDSSGGAGLQADLRVIGSVGVHAATAITCITAQTTLGVRAVWPLSPEQLVAQIEAIVADLSVAVVKVGMLGSAALAVALAQMLTSGHGVLAGVPVVLDPVLASSSGEGLADEDLALVIRRYLLPRTALVTPNLDEAACLTGLPVRTPAEMSLAGRALVAAGAAAALVKGGHLSGAPIDVLVDGSEVIELPGRRIEGGPFRGTGCTLASAIAAELALGRPLRDAVGRARGRIEAALVAALPFGESARLPVFKP